MNKIVYLFLVSVIAIQAFAQNEVEVDSSILNSSYTIEMATNYLDSNKTEEAIWILINSI